MVRAFTAFTAEVDDPDAAVRDLLTQLDFEGRLLGSTVGLLTCYADFVSGGVVAALCARLPFEVVGATTNANAACGQLGEFALTLMVLTSDDVLFTAALTQELSGPDTAALRAAYGQAMAGKSEKPALLLSFAPFLVDLSVDFFARGMEEVSGGVPNFGMVAVDHTPDLSRVQVIFNGEAYASRYAFLLLHGDIKPAFYLASVRDEKIFPEKGVVTASKGNLLEAVDGIPVIDWLASMGIERDGTGGIKGLNTFCFMMNYNDGTAPVVRAMLSITQVARGKTFAVCAGDVPEGVTLSLATISPHEIVASTKAAFDQMLRQPEPDVAVAFSCRGRYFALDFDAAAEMEAMTDKLRGRAIPCFLAYSGGELCPVRGPGGGLANRGHNETLAICTF